MSAYIYRVHEENIAALVDDQPYSGMVSTRKGKKRKLTVHAPPQDLDDPDVKAFVKRVELDSLRLFRCASYCAYIHMRLIRFQARRQRRTIPAQSTPFAQQRAR